MALGGAGDLVTAGPALLRGYFLLRAGQGGAGKGPGGLFGLLLLAQGPRGGQLPPGGPVRGQGPLRQQPLACISAGWAPESVAGDHCPERDGPAACGEPWPEAAVWTRRPLSPPRPKGQPCPHQTAVLLPPRGERDRGEWEEAREGDRDAEAKAPGCAMETDRGGRAAASTNTNQLEKQEERPAEASRPARWGLFFQNERPRERVGVAGCVQS